jgi:hypothetical protein
MALYRASCYTPPQGERVEGQAWMAPGPGATIRGWSNPQRVRRTWFERVDELARQLDLAYAGLTGGQKAGWTALGISRSELFSCPTDKVGSYNYDLHLYIQHASCFIEVPWGRCCQATPQIIGPWGALTWAVYGGGWWWVTGKLYNLCDIADWTSYAVYYGTKLTVTVYASVGGAVSLNGIRLEVGASRDVDYLATPPPCRIHRA